MKINKIGMAIVACLALSACTDPDRAMTVTHSLGYKDVHITGYQFWSCGDDYAYHTGFEATGLDGSHVTGVVCSGVFKGASVKID